MVLGTSANFYLILCLEPQTGPDTSPDTLFKVRYSEEILTFNANSVVFAHILMGRPRLRVRFQKNAISKSQHSWKNLAYRQSRGG